MGYKRCLGCKGRANSNDRVYIYIYNDAATHPIIIFCHECCETLKHFGRVSTRQKALKRGNVHEGNDDHCSVGKLHPKRCEAFK